MVVLQKSLCLIDDVNDWIGRVVSYGMLFMFILVLSEVIRRYFFNSPTSWGTELTQLTFGVYIVLSGPYVLRWGGHVNVDLLYTRFSPRGKAIIDIITFPIFLLFVGMLLVYGGSFAWESMMRLEHTESAWNPSVWPFKLAIPIAAFLLLLQAVAKLIRDIITVASGENPKETCEDRTGQ